MGETKTSSPRRADPGRVPAGPSRTEGRGERPSSALAAAGALTNPSRRRIAETLAEDPDGLSVSEIAGRVGLHHNAVRQHLRVLAGAGVIASSRDEPRGRGRPSERYRLVDNGAPSAAGHDELVRLLVELLMRVGIDDEEIVAFGREAGRRLGRGGDSGGIFAAVARLGFAPREVGPATDAGTLDLSLEHCPFMEAVLAPGGVAICRLHHGLLQGMAERVAPGAAVTRFEPRDPRSAGCRVRFEGLARETPG